MKCTALAYVALFVPPASQCVLLLWNIRWPDPAAMVVLAATMSASAVSVAALFEALFIAE